MYVPIFREKDTVKYIYIDKYIEFLSIFFFQKEKEDENGKSVNYECNFFINFLLFIIVLFFVNSMIL